MERGEAAFRLLPHYSRERGVLGISMTAHYALHDTAGSDQECEFSSPSQPKGNETGLGEDLCPGDGVGGREAFVPRTTGSRDSSTDATLAASRDTSGGVVRQQCLLVSAGTLGKTRPL